MDIREIGRSGLKWDRVRSTGVFVNTVINSFVHKGGIFLAN